MTHFTSKCPLTYVFTFHLVSSPEDVFDLLDLLLR